MRITQKNKMALLRDVTTIETTEVVRKKDKKVLSEVILVEGKALTISELLTKKKETVLQTLIDCYRENRMDVFNTIARQAIFEKELTREPDLRVLAALAALQKGMIANALKDCATHLNNGKYAQGYLLDGVVKSRAGHTKLAIQSFERGLAISKGTPIALRLANNNALQHYKLGSTDLALLILKEAIIADPENTFPLLRINLAKIYLESQRYGFAFDDSSDNNNQSYTARMAAKIRPYSNSRSEIAA